MGRDTLGRFRAGEPSCLTQEEKLRRAESLSKAWKSREGYIGDLISKHPKIYNSWRAIRFTEKGKKAGCCEEWKEYKNFYCDVIGTYIDGYCLRRKDVFLPWDKNNFMWVPKEYVGDLRERISLTYNGKTQTLKEWALELNAPISAIKIRYHKHKDEWSSEEILFGRKKKRNSKLAKDYMDPSVLVRAKASKMISSYKCKDVKLGVSVCDIDIDWMISNILTKPCEYCGGTHRIGCDRVDNSKGHTKDNVVPCCIECNTARNNFFTYEEMRRLGRTIAKIKKDRKNG